MSNPVHPPQLYDVVHLVRTYITKQTGREPSSQDVALCLAGASGVLAGLADGAVNEGRCAEAYDQAKLLSLNWKQENGY